MKLFVLVLCLVVQRYYAAAVLADGHDVFRLYWQKMLVLTGRVMQRNRWVLWLLMLLPACFALMIVDSILSSNMLLLGLFKFVFQVVVMLFCLATPIQVAALDACTSALDHDDVPAAATVMQNLFGCAFPTTKAEFLVAVEQMLLQKSLYYLFAIIFWYLLFGLMGAVVMRLMITAAEPGEHEAGSVISIISSVSQVVHYYMVWPVLRCLGITFALVGHFSRVLQLWVKHFFTRTPHEALLNEFAASALATNRLEDCHTTHDQQLVINLIDYSLVIWLIVVALVCVGGWLL